MSKKPTSGARGKRKVSIPAQRKAPLRGRTTIALVGDVGKKPRPIISHDTDNENPPLTARELNAMRRVSLAKEVRWKSGLSQQAFADAYRIPIGTLRDWEQHRSEPDQAAISLLRLIEADPKGVRKTLDMAPA